MNDLVAIRPDKAPRVKQIAVISGKGGTGKTSLVASFAALSRNSVLADCDVDAADLHLLLEPRVVRREPFTGGKRARIRAEQCTACGKCEELCRFDAISFDGPGQYEPCEEDISRRSRSVRGLRRLRLVLCRGRYRVSPGGEWRMVHL